MNFERGKDPKESMKIGKYRPLKKGDKIHVFLFDSINNLVEGELIEDQDPDKNLIHVKVPGGNTVDAFFGDLGEWLSYLV